MVSSQANYIINTLAKEESQHIDKLTSFCQHIKDEHRKHKIPFIITGVGISPDVPNVAKMMDKLGGYIDTQTNWNRSASFQNVRQEYTQNPSDALSQSKLLTYIQNAYLGNEHFVHPDDTAPLSEIWEKYVKWMLHGETDEKYQGILKAEASSAHEEIAKLCINMGAITITTNFDNLLRKAPSFKEDHDGKRYNFYPLLDQDMFNRYFTNTADDSSIIEIQSRGDVFWVSCSGKKNKTCHSINKRCYVPGEYLGQTPDNSIICNQCGSPVKVYFAFPGTKEKDNEMSNVMKGIWRFIAYRCSAVIVAGSSMNYDPVLLSFVQDLIWSRNIPLLYISRVNDGADEPRVNKATRAFFGAAVHEKALWGWAKEASDILHKINDYYGSLSSPPDKPVDDFEERINSYKKLSADLIGNIESGEVSALKDSLISNGAIKAVKYSKLEEINRYSQLGLKTYWMQDETEKITLQHNRYKHSLGVMSIASTLYLTVKRNSGLVPSTGELHFLQLAALFHDIGHLPFSHLIEEIFEEFGWISSGMSSTFNHEQYTRRRIEEFSHDKVFSDYIDGTGYSKDDLLNLIYGKFGVGYLDAIINSPIDADKIEYLFTDSIYTNNSHEAMFGAFMDQYIKGLSIDSNHMLVMEGESTQKMLELLDMRRQMYHNLYLRKGLRCLEAYCKLIIRTFFAYKCTESGLLENLDSSENMLTNSHVYSLSDAKINYVIGFLSKLAEKKKDSDFQRQAELEILTDMAEYLFAQRHLSEAMKGAVKICIEKIKAVKGTAQIYELEKNNVFTYEISQTQVDRKNLKNLTKTVYLRFPGVLLIDYVKNKSALSFGEAGIKRKRNDGTEEAVENILVRDINQSAYTRKEAFRCLGDAAGEIAQQLRMSDTEYINIYKITNDPFLYMQAADYVLSELRRLGLRI